MLISWITIEGAGENESEDVRLIWRCNAMVIYANVC